MANITPILKGQPSSSIAAGQLQTNFLIYGLIFVITDQFPILSKVLHCLVSVHLGQFMEGRDVLLTTQFTYRKGRGTCDALLCVAHTFQRALETGQEPSIFQIDFSAAFDRVNQQGILFKLCSFVVEGSVLSVLTQFL